MLKQKQHQFENVNFEEIKKNVILEMDNSNFAERIEEIRSMRLKPSDPLFPSDDKDADGFSTQFANRGHAWRGKGNANSHYFLFLIIIIE